MQLVKNPRLILLFLMASLLQFPAHGGEGASNKGQLVYVGTYTGAKSKGIYAYRMDTEDGQNPFLIPLGLAAETPNPSFLALDAKRRLLFAVNEISEFEGKPTGAVSAFSFDPATGKLTLLNQRPSMGTDPCHLLLDNEGKNLLVANYSSGSVTVLPVAPDGKLGEPTASVQHTGKSVHPDRQKGPHAHGITLSSDNAFVFVCDLGLDKVLIYRFDSAKGTLTPNDPAFAAVKPGAGPRHMVFRPDGRFAYVINELNSTVTVFAYDAKSGALKEVESVSTLPGYFDGPNTTAEIAVHSSGKYLFASNRGHNSIVLFNIDSDKGTLSWVEDQSTTGRKPRHFGMNAAGTHLAVANQDTDTVLICRADNANGRLKPAGRSTEAPSPVCVLFVPAGRD